VLIRCPKCHFDREISAARIPPNAVMATCPRCGERFRFRNVDGAPLPAEMSAPVEAPAASGAGESARGETAAAAVSEPRPRVMRETRSRPSGGTLIPISDEHPDDDPLPPGAMTLGCPEEAAEQGDDVPEEGRAASPQGGRPPLDENDRPAAGKAARQDRPASLRGEEADSARGGDSAGALRRPAGKAGAKDRAAASGGGAPLEDMDIPWERPDRYNPVVALYQTILRVMFGAPRFFAAVPSAEGGLGRPLLFYLLLGLFQTLMQYMWFRMSIEARAPFITDPQMQEMLGSMAQNMSLPLTLLFSPVLFTFQLVAFAGVFFLMVRLVQPEQAAFAVLFRVVAYSAAPMILYVVPVVGPLVATLWFAVSCLIGVRYALDLSWSRVLLALGPLYAIVFSFLLQNARQLLGS